MVFFPRLTKTIRIPRVVRTASPKELRELKKQLSMGRSRRVEPLVTLSGIKYRLLRIEPKVVM